MSFTKNSFLIIFIIFSTFVCDKAIAQNENKPAEQRVIYEQNMSYDDARQMKAIVEKMEKEKETEETNSDQVNPIMDAMNNDSDQNSEMIDMLKTLLKAMGVDDLPKNNDEQQGLVEGAKPDKKGESDFKSWGDRHKWKGLRSE